MTIDELQALIAQGEHRTLKVKKTTGELTDGMRTACAFLNTDGGWLLFGVAPSAIQKHINNLKAKQKIVRVGGDLGGHWKVLD